MVNSSAKRKPNITVPITGTDMIRYLSASSDRFDPGLLGRLGSIRYGYSLATTVTEVRSRALALKYTSTDSRNITENRPFLAPSRPAKASLYKPFVAVQCQEYRRGSQGWHDLQFPHDNLLAPPVNDYIKERWAVLDEAWKPFSVDRICFDFLGLTWHLSFYPRFCARRRRRRHMGYIDLQEE